ncbi:MAG: NADH-quinone oxidoreductase subunit A [Gammaproteobacteria bacterium]|nr:NADH-quinone oxidoreductase subunit A [Gammaproteobacteria bacterium]
MLNNYIPILFFIGLGLAIGILPLLLGRLLAPHKPYLEKVNPYECGFDPFGDARSKFDVRFYLVSILFIIFDLEVAFLLPWATVIDKINWLGFSAMLFFLVLLVVGFIYEWQKGALEWE